MKRGSAILLAASVAGVGAALAAGAVRAEERLPGAGAPPQQVVVQVNSPVAEVCAHRAAAYGDCGCYPANATSVTVLDAPFQPGAMYFVNPAPVVVKNGRWR
jgi:hypothetical protein